MATLLVGSLLFLASPVASYRRQEAAVLNPGFAGVEQFLAWASKSCEDCGATIGGLLQGVQDAGYLAGSAWEGNTLTVELSESRLYGEIAATSRIPTSWTLGNKATFTFTGRDDGATEVRVDGFGVQPAPQGLELYEAAMKNSKDVDPTKCVDDFACIDLEIKAAGKYLYGYWKQIKKSDDKITRIMKTLYSRYAIYLAVEGLGKWGEIFYALLMPKPAAITSLVFRKGTVYTTFDVLADPRYDKYNLGQKARAFGRMQLEASSNGPAKSIALQYARSSFNFGALMGYGNNEETLAYSLKVGNTPADVGAVANLFAWCAGTAESQLPTCSGKTPGRVGWAPTMKS